MDHRLGKRVGIDVPIRWAQDGALPLRGCITDVSLSGACVECVWDARTSPVIILDLSLAELSREMQAARLTAHIVRVTARGIGIEWCEFAPIAITEWIRSLTGEPLIAIPAIDSVRDHVQAA